MGEHTAFLLLLVATLTLSSEVSIHSGETAACGGVLASCSQAPIGCGGPVHRNGGKPMWRIDITAIM